MTYRWRGFHFFFVVLPYLGSISQCEFPFSNGLFYFRKSYHIIRIHTGVIPISCLHRNSVNPWPTNIPSWTTSNIIFPVYSWWSLLLSIRNVIDPPVTVSVGPREVFHFPPTTHIWKAFSDPPRYLGTLPCRSYSIPRGFHVMYTINVSGFILIADRNKTKKDRKSG